MLHTQLTHSKQVEKHSDNATGICLRGHKKFWVSSSSVHETERAGNRLYLTNSSRRSLRIRRRAELCPLWAGGQTGKSGNIKGLTSRIKDAA